MKIRQALFERIKQLMRRNEFVYGFLLRKVSPFKRYPNSATKITIEGYPRSANTFSLYLASELIERAQISSHIHNIACLKASRACKIPTIVLIRAPQESVVSWMQKNRIEPNSKRAARIYLKQWSEFYTFVLKNFPESKVVPFKDVTSSPCEFVLLVAKLTRQPLEQTDAKKLTSQAIKKLEYKENQKPWHASSLPKEGRAGDKEGYERLTSKLEELSQAEDIYTQLLSRAYKL